METKEIMELLDNVAKLDGEMETKDKLLKSLSAELNLEKSIKAIEDAGYLIAKKNKNDDKRRIYNHITKSYQNQKNLFNLGFSASIVKHWLSNRKTGVYVICVRPDKPYGKFIDEYGETCWNTFDFWQKKIKKGDWTTIRDYLFRIICDSNEDDFDYLLKWCSKVIAHPETKSAVAVALGGTQGSGKDTFYYIFRYIIGTLFCQRAKSKELKEKFNSFLDDNILVYMNESALDDELYETTKEWITDDETKIHYKGVDATTKKNFSNFILATNKPSMINLTADDRRWFILETSSVEVGTEYWENFWQNNELTEKIKEEILCFADYLFELDVKSLKKPPLNEAKQDQIKMAESKIIKWFHNFVKDPECKKIYFNDSAGEKVIKASLTHQKFLEDPNGENVNIKYFIKELERNGRIKTKIFSGTKHFIITDLLNNEETTIEEMLNVEENKI